MALIGTLRTKMTKVVVGFVAIAMIAFIVGSDLFGSGPRSIFGGDQNSAGEIAGHTISREEYQNAVRERENNYVLNMGRTPGDREQTQLRNEAWELLILKYAIYPEIRKVGVKVTADEQWDMVQGKNVDETIKSSFVDSAGNFDRARLNSWMRELDAPDNPNMMRWTSFKAGLVSGRERLKYEYLLIKTNFVTDAEAERDYHSQNDVVEAKYLTVPFSSVSDTLVNPTDSDLEKYYNKNREKFKSEQSRDLIYVSFPVVASTEDSTMIKQDMQKIAVDFAAAKDDSLFAVSTSEGNNAYTTYTPSTLPAFLSNQKEKLAAGQLFGPFIERGNYKIMKVVKAGTDTTYEAKASHILIRWDNETPAAKAEARAKAEKIRKDIAGGASFVAKAFEFGTDGTKTRGGDLGWFKSGAMVKPFQDAVFAAKKPGLLPNLVETQFGYHIIDVTGVKTNMSYTVATVEREITPSEETDSQESQRAQAFLAGLENEKAFRKWASQQGLSVFEGKEVGPSDRTINNLGDARTIVSWLYRDDTSPGKLSEVFDLNDNYVVAVMTGEVEEGIKPFEKVKEEITPAVKDELKSKIIIDKLATLTGTLEEIAKAYGPDATVNSASDIKLNSNSVASIGFDPVAVGTAFSLENGKRSKAFAGEKSAFIIEVQNKTSAPEIGDYSMFKTQLLQNLDNRSTYGVTEAIKKAADIKDYRYRFY